MTCLTFSPLQQTTLFKITLCKYSLSLSTCKHQKLHNSPLHVVKTVGKSTAAKLSGTEHELATKILNLPTREETDSGNSYSKGRDKRVEKDSVKRLANTVVEDKNGKRFTQESLGFRKNKEKSPRSSNLNPVVENCSRETRSSENDSKTKNDGNVKVETRGGLKWKTEKVDLPEIKLRVALDMCSKRGDVIGAIQLYELALREGIKLGQHHYTVLLYLCSSAALGVVQPAKSGRGIRTLDAPVSSSSSLDDGKFGAVEPNYLVSQGKQLVENGKACGSVELAGPSSRSVLPMDVAKHRLINDFKDNDCDPTNRNVQSCNQEDNKFRVSEEVKEFALLKGFAIYEKMCLDKVPMNEATLTAVARMAMSMGNGDMAFDMVKQMKSLGINPRLRSYGPALTSFCNSDNINKAFAVEKHMLAHGVNPEEPELEALLRVSVATGNSNKVYYLLHKLRTSVRKVSHSTADLIISWFESSMASRVGKIKWDQRLIKEAIANGGGGWHGQGWLGRGKWTVLHTTVGTDGFCKSCGEKLAIIDLDPVETENFAESVASLAMKREKGSSFQNFQKWLDYYGPFEAVVDAANVGLFTQRKFKPSKVNLVVNGIRKKLPSKKWPLIILHNRRLKGQKIDEPVNRAFVEKWRNADALYATPTGSNDDWYWLYAAIKFKCLLITNDEMRDHTFQFLGNDFFPRWKERHQVRFSFSDVGPEFHMPPPCSVVIQESEKGHWHIPIESEVNYEEERTWLCVTRRKSQMQKRDPVLKRKDKIWGNVQLKYYTHLKKKGLQTSLDMKGNSRTADTTQLKRESHKENSGSSGNINYSSRKMYKSLRNILPEYTFSKDYCLLSQLEDAEKLANCSIDFQI